MDAPAGLPIRVVLLEESTLIAETLRRALEARNSLHVVGCATRIEGTLEILERTSSDILVVRAIDEGTDEEVRRVRQMFGDVKVVVLGTEPVEEELLRWIEAGACGCVPADSSLDDLVRTIEEVHRGTCLCSPRLAARVGARIHELSRELGLVRAAAPQPEPLTPRESEILRLLAAGLSNKEIASRLRVRLATVKTHIHNLYEKLGARGRREALRMVHRRGDLLS